jgi:hypothetical protein
MAAVNPFEPGGKTYQGSATTTSQVVTITPDTICNQLLVANHAPSGAGAPVYFRMSTTDSAVTVATPSATAQYALVSVQDDIRTYTIPGQCSPTVPLYVAIIAESGTAEAYFTPGNGKS